MSQLAKDLQKGLLYGILRVLPIVGDVLSDAEEPAVVSLYKLLERGSISPLAAMDEIHVVTAVSATANDVELRITLVVPITTFPSHGKVIAANFRKV